MTVANEQRLLSIIGVGVALTALTLTIIEQVQLQRSLAEAASLGAIIDVSPDQLQMNLRVSLAFALGAIALWSNRAHKVAAIAAALLVGIGILLFAETNPFDRAEPQIHITGICFLAIALVCIRWRHGDLLTAGLAEAFVAVNYLLWFMWTQRIKRFAEVEQLYPNTRLNNLFYGARPWHIVFLAVIGVLIIWECRLLKRRLTKVVPADAG